MQALIARHGRVSTAMIGDNRMGGSMSDAAKRRCDESESSFTHLVYEDFGSADVLEPPYVQEETHGKSCMVRASRSPMDPEIVKRLPDGVESVEQWGDTVMAFGKFEKKATYREVMEKPEHAGYRKWCEDHLSPSTSKGAVLDFVKYMEVYRLCCGHQMPLMIPGTTIQRTFRPSQK